MDVKKYITMASLDKGTIPSGNSSKLPNLAVPLPVGILVVPSKEQQSL